MVMNGFYSNIELGNLKCIMNKPLFAEKYFLSIPPGNASLLKKFLRYFSIYKKIHYVSIIRRGIIKKRSSPVLSSSFSYLGKRRQALI